MYDLIEMLKKKNNFQQPQEFPSVVIRNLNHASYYLENPDTKSIYLAHFLGKPDDPQMLEILTKYDDKFNFFEDNTNHNIKCT